MEAESPRLADASDINDDLAPEAAHGKLFLSYKRQEAGAVEGLVEALHERHIEVWIDTQGIPPGAEWPKRVGVAIGHARGFLAMVSPAFLSSPNCRRELEEAERAGKRLIPVVLDSTLRPEDMPASLRDANWIPWDAGIASVADAVQRAAETDVEWLDEHARLHTTAMRFVAGAGWSVALRGSDLRESAALLDRMQHRVTPPFVTEEQRALVVGSRVRRRVWGGAIGLTAVILVLLGMLFLQARSARIVSESQRLASQAQGRMDDQPDLATRLALFAVGVDDTPAAESALLESLTNGPGLRSRSELGFEIDVAHLDPAGQWALVVDDRGDLKLVELDGGGVTPFEDLDDVNAVWVADARAVAGTEAGRAAWLSAAEGDVEEFCPLAGRISAVGMSGSLTIAAAGADDRVEIVALDETCSTSAVASLDRPVAAAAFDHQSGRWAIADRSGSILTGVGMAVDSERVSGDVLVGSASSLAVSGELLVVGRDSGVIEVRPWADLADVRTITAHSDVVSSVTIREDRIVTGSLDGAVRVWNTSDSSLAASFDYFGRDRVPFQPGDVRVDGDRVVSIGLGGQLLEWSMIADSPLVEPVLPGRAVGVAHVASDPVISILPGFLGRGSEAAPATALVGLEDGSILAGFSDGEVARWNGDWIHVTSLSRPIEHIAGGRSVVAASDGATLALVSDERAVRVEGVGPVKSLAIARDDTVFAGTNDAVRRWAVDGSELEPVFTDHLGTVDAIASSPDGAWVITAGDDRVIRIWSASEFEPVATLVGHSEKVLDLDVSKDMQRMVSVDESGLMIYWDLNRFTAVAPPIPQPSSGLVEYVEFDSDRSVLAAGPGLVRWRLSDADILDAACSFVVDRRLTESESNQFLRSTQTRDPCADALD